MTQPRNSTRPHRHWRSIFALALVAVAVVGVCIAAKSWWPATTATAQNRSAGQASGAAGTRARRTSQIPQATAKPKVVAIVNGQPISRQKLAQEAVRRYGKDVVENLVNKHLILQACQRRGVQITAQELENEIRRMAGKFGLSKERWLEMLKQERNINPQQYRNDIIWPTLALRKLADDKLAISDEELRKARETEYGPKVQVRMIMIKDKDRCQQVHRYLKTKPEEFGKVAKDYSEDETSASARGLIPPVRKHVGEPAIEKACFALTEEDPISEVVAAAGQHFIFKLEKHIPATPMDPQFHKQAEARIKESLKEQKLREVAGEIFQKLQDEANVINVYNNPQLREQMPGVAATINGQKLTVRQLAEECIARHGVEVLEGEINRQLLQQQLKSSEVAIEQSDINEEVARAAEMYGFVKSDGTPDVQAWLKKVVQEDDVTVDLYVQDAVWPTVALKKLVGSETKVTEEDIEKAYEANYGEQVEVLVCVLGSQRRAQEVWEMARANPTDQFFGDLAHQYSIEPTSKYNFGKVPPIRKFSGQPHIEKEAFQLQPGDLSGIVAAGNNFIIMRCVGRTKPESPPALDEVRDELFNDIREKKLRIGMAQRFDQIRESAQIDNFLAGTTQLGGSKGPATHDRGVRPASANFATPGR